MLLLPQSSRTGGPNFGPDWSSPGEMVLAQRQANKFALQSSSNVSTLVLFWLVSKLEVACYCHSRLPVGRQVYTIVLLNGPSSLLASG